jgi:hypothetical protein
MFFTIIVGLIGFLTFNLMQKKFRFKNHILEIKKNLLPLDKLIKKRQCLYLRQCLYKRQCLDQIKLNVFKLKYIPLADEQYLNQYRLANHILSNLYDNTKLTLHIRNNKYFSETTKHFTFCNDDITILWGYVSGRYLFREVDKKLLNLSDFLTIDYIDQKDYSKLAEFKFNYYAKDTDLIQEYVFVIDNFKFVDNTIVLDVSNDSNDTLE